MSKETKDQILTRLRGHYAMAGLEHKGKLLDQAFELLGYHRKAAIRALSSAKPAKVVLMVNLVMGRPKTYLPDKLLPIIKPIWVTAFQPCGSRLTKTEVVWCSLPQVTMAEALGFFIHRCHPRAQLFGYEPGNIYIPRWVFSHRFWENRGSLREVIRHEYGHALVFHYPELFAEGSDYKRVFGRPGSDENFVSEYAQTDREEDFAETFMVWWRMFHHRNSDARKAQKEVQRFSPALRKKFGFIEKLAAAVAGLDEERLEVVCPQTGDVATVDEPEDGAEFICPHCNGTIRQRQGELFHAQALTVSCPLTGGIIELEDDEDGEYECPDCGAEIAVVRGRVSHLPVFQITCPAKNADVLLTDGVGDYVCPHCQESIRVKRLSAQHL